MTYSLNTLNSSRTAAALARSGWRRFADELALLAGLLLSIFWLVALLTYSAQDSAWSTSGSGVSVLNRAGPLGAWLADGSYFLLGFSVWWCVAAGLRVWLSGLARWLRGRELMTPQREPGRESLTSRFTSGRAAFWGGLVLLLCASAALEWSRFYSMEARLPGHSGGILGYFVGPRSVQWFGFVGSGLVAIALGVVGAALVFRFSWGHVAERLGASLVSQFETRREKREVAQDVAMGRRAARQREAVLVEERHDNDGHRPLPVMIEPVLADLPKSVRVAKERQKPLFTELPDSKLPQVDLLDAALARQETVAPETLEMTSRMIEKKLRDFGVEVRVVLAQPGPVITRYEIEPATGVKGSQIVGLAKDLARSLSLVSIRVVETIPGKNFMALELPNAKRQSIKLSEILGSQIYYEAKSMLTMGLG